MSTRTEREARATILQSLKAQGRVPVDQLAAALGLRLRAAVDDLMSDSLVMIHQDGTIGLTPRGRLAVDNMGSVKAD